MLLGHVCHVDAHLTVGHKVVAQQDEEGVVVDLVGSAVHGMAKAERLVLIGKAHGQARCLVDGIGKGVLALGAQHLLKGLIACEIALDLGLLVRVDDDDAIYALGLESLLDHILDDRLVEHRQELLCRALGCREKTSAETGGRNDCLHGMQNLRGG